MKKSAFFFLLFCLYSVVYGQDVTLSKQANILREKVAQTQDKEQLKWLDSLTTIVWRKPGFNFDSIAQVTIKYAIEQDTADLAAYHVVNRMYYYSGGKGDLKTSEKIFLDFETHHISKVKKPRRLSNFYKAGGLQYYNMDEYGRALLYYDKALLSAVKTTDSQAIGEIFMGKGMVYFNQGKLMESSQNLQKSIPYFKTSGGVNAIINVKNIMTSLYSENGFYEEAEKERAEALALATKEEHHLFLSQIYFNQSVELRTRGKLKERIKYIEMALDEVAQSKYKKYYKPIYIAGMVTAKSELDDISGAQKYWNLLQKEERKNAPGETTAFYKEAKMRLAYAKKNYKLALAYGQDYYNYKTEIKQFDGLEEAEQFLAKVYTVLGEDKKANKHLVNYQKLNDSITGIKKAKILSYYQTLYETEKRDAKISTQEAEISLLDAQSKIKTQWMLFGGLGLLLAFGLFIALRSRAFAQKKQRMQQQFSQDLLVAQEDERKYIAKELHDGIGQDLLLIKNSLQLDIEKTPKLVDKTIDDIRTLSQNLHPIELEKFGLTKAIINMVETVSEVTNILFTEEVDNIDKSFSEEKEIYLYRIIQECINNIIKHSEATASKIAIEDGARTIVITIQDNGKGFNINQGKNKAKSLGLKSLMERVNYLKGSIEFETNVTKGTKVIITLHK